MKKLLALCVVLVAAVGCSTCHDGTVAAWGNSTQYDPCGMGCVNKKKACECSKQCPCWDKHPKNPDSR